MENTEETADKTLEALKALIAQVNKAAKLDETELQPLVDEFKKLVQEKFDAGKAAGKEEVKAEVETLKTENTKQLKDIDGEYTKLFKESIDLLESKYTKILEKLATFAETKFKNPKTNMVLVEKISKFFDAYIDEAIGEKPIVESEKLARLQKFYDNIRESVQFSNEDLQKTIAEKSVEVDKELKTVKESLNTALKDRIVLVQENNKFKKEELLSKELSNKPKIIVEKVRTALKDADLKVVTESIKDTIKKVESEIDDEHAAESEKHKPSGERIVESATARTDGSAPDVMEAYAHIVERQIKMGV
jgi:hypothetical protein